MQTLSWQRCAVVPVFKRRGLRRHSSRKIKASLTLVLLICSLVLVVVCSSCNSRSSRINRCSSSRSLHLVLARRLQRAKVDGLKDVAVERCRTLALKRKP